jgi:hypothetical protein
MAMGYSIALIWLNVPPALTAAVLTAVGAITIKLYRSLSTGQAAAAVAGPGDAGQLPPAQA